MENILLIGAGGHAKSLIDLIESRNNWQIFGLIGTTNEIGKTCLGYKILGDESYLEQIISSCHNAILAIGQIQSSLKRIEISKKLEDLGFNFPIISSNYSFISKHAKIGEGTTIGHGAIINAGAVIGKHCIINSQALVEHDSKIGDFCHISTGALVNGGVVIGKESFIGSNSVIRENLTLPSKSLVSAGKRIMGWPLKIHE